MVARAVVTVLAAGMLCGCAVANYEVGDSPRQLHGVDAAAAVLGAGAVVAGSAADASMRAEKPAKRRLTAVRGKLLNASGEPLRDATIVVHSGPRYTDPAAMKTSSVKTGPDGGFSLPIEHADVVCVDFAADGKVPVRRWFVVLQTAGMKGLPAERGEISYVSPDRKISEIMAVRLVDRE